MTSPSGIRSSPKSTGASARKSIVRIWYPAWVRILFAVASVFTVLFSLGAYMVWGVADFYGPTIKDIYIQLFLAASILLLLISVYLLFFALIGHKLVPNAIHIPVLILSVAIALLSGYFVSIALF